MPCCPVDPGNHDDALQIEEGALYTSLHRLEKRGWLESSWGLSENNRRAKFYGLTDSGEKQLRKGSRTWARYAEAMSKVLGAPEGAVHSAGAGGGDMKILPGFDGFFRLSAFRPDPDGDLEAELSFHFRQTEEELMERGYSPTEAREEAHRRFGNVRDTGKRCRESTVELPPGLAASPSWTRCPGPGISWGGA